MPATTGAPAVVCRRMAGANARTAAASGPATRVAASSAHTSALFDADLRRHVGTPVVAVLETVAEIELADRDRHRDADVERVRQPHVGKRLRHRHRRLDVVDVY